MKDVEIAIRAPAACIDRPRRDVQVRSRPQCEPSVTSESLMLTRQLGHLDGEDRDNE
jgi:hypothetical protein